MEVEGRPNTVHNASVMVITAGNTREWRLSGLSGPGGFGLDHDLRWNPKAGGAPERPKYSRHRVGMLDRPTPACQPGPEDVCEAVRVAVSRLRSTGRELFPRGGARRPKKTVQQAG